MSRILCAGRVSRWRWRGGAPGAAGGAQGAWRGGGPRAARPPGEPAASGSSPAARSRADTDELQEKKQTPWTAREDVYTSSQF